MNEPSPYKEVGLTAADTLHPRKPRMEKVWGGCSGRKMHGKHKPIKQCPVKGCGRFVCSGETYCMTHIYGRGPKKFRPIGEDRSWR